MKLKFHVISPDTTILFSRNTEKELPIRVIINKQPKKREERGRLIF